MAVSLGFTPGQVVQEFYVDDDVDEALRQQIVDDTGNEIVDLDYGNIVDGVIIWWRADDAEEEDLADVLMDGISNFDDDGGTIWVLTPVAGSAGEVPLGDVEEAAGHCGLQSTSSQKAGDDWLGIRLISRARP